MAKVTNEQVFEYVRGLTDFDRSTTIDAAMQTDDPKLAAAAMKYLRTVYSMAHPKPVKKHYDETRAYIIQLDEMGILDSM